MKEKEQSRRTEGFVQSCYVMEVLGANPDILALVGLPGPV